MFDSLAKAGKYLGQAAKLMIGMPDYDNYVLFACWWRWFLHSRDCFAVSLYP